MTNKRNPASPRKHRIWYIVLSGIIIVLIAVVYVFGSSILALSPPNGVPPGRASITLDSSVSPAIGNINGIKLSIPHNYLFSGVQYEGEEPLMTKPRQFKPTYNSKIVDFAILLRLSNMQPIRTAHDWDDYNKATHKIIPPYYEIWTTIGFSPKHYWHDGAVQDSVKRWEKDDAKWGPFVKQKDLVYGLVHEDSVQSLDNDKFHLGHYEFFYTPEMQNTFIQCRTSRQKVPPYAVFNTCTHLFIVPELKVVAEAVYTKKDLPRWREIEEKSKEIIHSFLVQ